MSLKEVLKKIKNLKRSKSKKPTAQKKDIKVASEFVAPSNPENVSEALSENESQKLNQIKSKHLPLYNSIKKLNVFQQRAVFSDNEKILVSAMVGSGKTTVLVHKILYLHFFKGVPLDKIGILTFTNKAANEIVERILTFYMGQAKTAPDLSLCGTFHSVAKNILSHSELLDSIGYTDSFTIMDENEKVIFLKRIVLENNLNVKYINRLDKRIERFLDPRSTTRRKKILYGNMKYEDDIEELIKISAERKKSYNVMDFDDLIANVNIVMSSNKFDLGLDWIVIDEFQDSNTDQITMINNMANDRTSVFAVGDPNQLIYAWRGSDIGIFSDFKEKTCEEHSLPINYRSTSNILDLAKVMKTYGDEELLGNRSGGLPVTIVNHYDSNQEAIYLASQIKNITQKGVPLREIAILFRTRNQSKIFETVFTNEEIPFEVANRRTIRDLPPVYWLTLLFRSCLNKHDMNSIYDLVFDKDYGFHELSTGLVRKYLSDLKKQNIKPDLENFLEWMIDNKSMEKEFLGFSKQMLGFSKWIEDVTFEEIPEIFDYFNLSLLLRSSSSNYENDVELVKSFLDNLSRYVQLDYDTNVKRSFLTIVSKMSLDGINIVGDTIDPNSEKVKLLTMHTAKGLEFGYVFISGANDGLIPMALDCQEPAQFEEEKRLFFVAITRAKDFLEISYHTNPEGRSSVPEMSCFLKNIPKSVIKVGARKKTSRTVPVSDNTDIDKLDKWYTGQSISHHKYGSGEIAKITETNIICCFDGFGEKSFSVNFLAIKPQ